jgi:hypothetical protein
MDNRVESLEPMLARLDTLLSGATAALSAGRRPVVERWRGDAEALRFHLRELRHARPEGRAGAMLVAVLGGTGTGKSTLVNRILSRSVSAASFRRTFTSGPVAIVPDGAAIPANWLGVEHVVTDPADLPARGRPGALLIVNPPAGHAAAPLPLPVLIDTPDLDGDQPTHHAQADRVFRWAQAVLFLVTPEKYQMTELLPYYRLARRYAVPALFVMNKCEEQAVAEDYRRQLDTALQNSGTGSEAPDERGNDGATSGAAMAVPDVSVAAVFSLARDGAGYEPPAAMNLEALRQALSKLAAPAAAAGRTGLGNRSRDLFGRLADQVVSPLREDRKHADELIDALRAMEAPAVGVDVNPLTRQLHRRLQQRSILYLMGPGRVLDRVRQAPMLLARLPRFAWDYLRNGQVSAEMLNPAAGSGLQTVPDFRAALADQFAVLQSRIDDALRASPAGQSWIGTGADDKPYAVARIDPSEAGKIADEELAELNAWLERKWNATPRDTRMLESFLRFLPGGRSLGRWSEAAPYLLTIVLIVAHHAITGGTDLLVVGGYTLATWLTERLSNEVAARTRATNLRIESRFAELAHDQITRVCAWLDRQAPPEKMLDRIERAAEEMSAAIE